jgi:hypothetical protein
MRQVFCAALAVFALYSPAHAQQQPPTTVAVGVRQGGTKAVPVANSI